ncbi:MAG: hypothetical protein AB7K68_16470 [Bacteriovoracia bacterium]
MTRWVRNKQLLLPLTAASLLVFSSPFARAAEEITPTLGPASQEKGGGAKESEDNSKSFMREWTFENSFDKAGDANQNLENSLKGNINYNCDQYRSVFEKDGKKYAASPELAAQCDQRQKAARNFRGDVASIKKQQRIFAEVSRVSDIAAVGAVGAVAYAELGQKKNNQSSTYTSAANLQEKAGIVAYTTGAADVSMGAWAYVQQKRKLEAMQETLNGKNSGISGKSGNSTLDSRLAAAIEKTKEAAYKHMLYGAGKVAAGYASMKLAERSKKQAESMASIELAQSLQVSSGVTTGPVAGSSGGTAGTFQTGQPSFSLATDTGTSTATATATNAESNGSSTGSSSLFGNSELRSGISNRTPADTGSGAGAPAGGLSFGNSGPDAAAVAKEEEEKAAQAEVAKSAFGFGEFSRGGGGGTFSGGSGSAAAGEDVPAALNGLVAGLSGDPAPSVASRINPNQMYDEATAGIDGNEQGSMVGVSGNRDKSLFETIKFKHTKALQSGNVQGPASVEVRN